MIDLGGEGVFVRFWLPLCLLAVLIIFLFPKFGAPDRTQAREAWDGVVALLQLDPPPEEDLQLVATLPLRAAAGGPERLVVGEARWSAGVGSRPILLRTPPRNGPGARVVRRVDPQAVSPGQLRVTLSLFRCSDLGDRSLLGARLRSRDWFDGEATHPLPASLLELPHEIRVDDIRHRRWPGDPARFDDEWGQFGSFDPGGLAAFIHARVLLPALPPEGSERAGSPPGE